MSATDSTQPSLPPTDAPVTSTVQRRLADLGVLLENLAEAPQNAQVTFHQNQLIQVRLGIASGLYTALRIRHAPTAEHSLRVSLGCSSWAMASKLDNRTRDNVEVAALLHDIGKIGTPDSILRSARPMSTDEANVMADSRRLGKYVLAGCCASQEILDIIEFAPAWYDGSLPEYSRQGQDLPLGSRMIAIVDAFDSMTTDHVYRAAMPFERAISELYSNAGHQFDPELVEQFAELHTNHVVSLKQNVAQRWLKDLSADQSNTLWELSTGGNQSVGPQSNLESLFHGKMMDSMLDGVVFVDQSCCIIRWNPGAEQLSNITSNSVVQRQWVPSLLGLRDVQGAIVPDEDCPVAQAIRSGTQSMHRLLFKGRRDSYVTVDLHVVPIIAADGKRCGATITLRDASPETNLEERVQSLHEKASRDPLTGIANRAEFDRHLEESVRQHLAQSSPCSLIICDIDHFKRINDTFGHQAGDEVLVNFAAMLQRSCRHGDHVARYGGEEFVVICKNCPAPAAFELAEKMRSEWGGSPRPELDDYTVTTSFGVTELQPGDTAETMLRRADRALYKAKGTGRDRVVQLGSGMDESVEKSPKFGGWWATLMKPASSDELVDCYLATNVPVNVAVEKLRGFVSDHEAEIVNVTEEEVAVRIQVPLPGPRRHQIIFAVKLKFLESPAIESSDGKSPPTILRVSIRSLRRRERRGGELLNAARTLVRSLKAYLMAQNYDMRHQRIVSGDSANSAK